MKLLQIIDIRKGNWSEIGEALRAQFFIQDTNGKTPLLGGYNGFKTLFDVKYVGSDYDANGFCTSRRLKKNICDEDITMEYDLRKGVLAFYFLGPTGDACCVYNNDASKQIGWLGMWLSGTDWVAV
jgi:hypothetical protein